MSNPNVEVWVQVSVNPPGNPHITADQVVSRIMEISGMVDGIWIYYHKSRWAIAKEVVEKLRKNVEPLSAVQTLNIQILKIPFIKTRRVYVYRCV